MSNATQRIAEVSSPSSVDLANFLARGLDDMRLDVNAERQKKLLEYLAQLVKWNATYNLTAVRDPLRMVAIHLLDSLAVAPYLPPGANVADVGCGAGLPGIPLSLIRPDMTITLIDAVSKKIAFVQHVIGTLGIPNAKAQHARVEAASSEGPFDVVISRAFAELKDFVVSSRALLGTGGRWLAMKGAHPHDEIARLDGDIDVEQVIPLHVPDVDGPRCLVVMRPIPVVTKTESGT